MSLEISDHFDKRFAQRIAKTKRMPKFASRALRYGKGVEEIKYSALRKELAQKEKEYGTVARVYRNSVYWFCGDTAVTVYPLAQKYHGRV